MVILHKNVSGNCVKVVKKTDEGEKPLTKESGGYKMNM
jgi:hypothetical protein